MIELYINGNLVNLPEEVSIRIEKYNPLFNKMKSRSFHFAIPYSVNRYVLNIDDQLPFSLYVNGLLDMQGIAEIEEGIDYDTDEIELYLQENNTFWENVKNVSLHDYDFGDEQLPATEADRKTLFDDIVTNEKLSPDSNFTLPMFYDTAQQLGSGGNNRHIINEYNFSDYELYGKSDTVYSISFYLRAIMRLFFLKEGFQITQDDMGSDSDFDRLLIMSFTEYDIGLSYIPIDYYLPDVTFKDFFNILETLFGIRFIIDKNEVKIFIFDQLLQDNDIITTQWQEVENEKKYKLESVVPAYSYTGVSHPDYDDITEYFSENDIKKTEQQLYYFGDSTGLGSDVIYKSELTQRLYKPDGNGLWIETGNLRAYNTGEEQKEARASVFFTRTEAIKYIDVYFYRDDGQRLQFTHTFSHINSETSREYNPIGTPQKHFEDLVLLYNRGIEDREIEKTAADGTYYKTFKIPHVTYDVYLQDRSVEFETLKWPNQKSLRWQTEYGLYNNYKKVTDHWEQNRKRKVIKYFYMTTGQVKNIQWEKKYKINDRIYFINKLEYDVTESGMSIVKAELFTV